MVSTVELVLLVAARGPIEQAQIDAVDVVKLGRVAVTVLGWQALPGAAGFLHGGSSDDSAQQGSSSNSGRVWSVSPTQFVRAILREDPNVATMAADVDPLRLAAFVLVVSAWPKLKDPAPWLDRYEVAQLDPDLGPSHG